MNRPALLRVRHHARAPIGRLFAHSVFDAAMVSAGGAGSMVEMLHSLPYLSKFAFITMSESSFLGKTWIVIESYQAPPLFWFRVFSLAYQRSSSCPCLRKRHYHEKLALLRRPEADDALRNPVFLYAISSPLGLCIFGIYLLAYLHSRRLLRLSSPCASLFPGSLRSS
jgi:hypothetical protein